MFWLLKIHLKIESGTEGEQTKEGSIFYFINFHPWKLRAWKHHYTD